MTGYRPADLAEGWEFKILRSATGAFRNPDHVRDALQQEAKAGWVLVEKFDNQRLRLKRPASAKARDGSLGFDPYRSFYGMGGGQFALVIVGSIMATLALVLTTIVVLTRR